ncbi:hypothetical protein Tco_1327266 [Tanacetum coccineum]
MAQLKYCDKHNQVGFLRKPDESAGFAEIVDFLRGSNLRYALTANPTIYDSLVKQFWQSAIANTKADGSLEINATIDTIRYTISEASIRESLQLEDATGITMLPNDDLFEGMGQIGYPTDGTFTFWKSFFTPQWRYLVHHLLHCISSKSGGWDQFGSNIATALICLSTGRVYNFSKLIFDGMVANLKSKTKFLMYPRFLQMILNIQTENKHLYLAVSLTKKIFGNMKRGFQKQKIDDKDVPAIGEKVAEVKEEDTQEDSETDKEESVEAMNPTPLTTKSDSVVNWKIFQQSQRSVYQIIRVNRADTVYMSFRAMIKDFTREDLIELYRLVMQKYGTNRPEDAYDRVLWSDLRTMFDPPLIEDAIWSLPLQQKMNQGTWKLSQLKKLSFEEVKEEFDKLVKQVESFAPISFEATKASLKRFGEEIQTKTPKRQKDDKDVEAG